MAARLAGDAAAGGADAGPRFWHALGLPDGHLLGVGVDRMDYTKGILERFMAVERMLELHPELVGRFSFIQIAAPSRSALEEYQAFEARVRALAERINQRFTRDGRPAIILKAEHHEPDEVNRYYRAADVCMVTSLHDGMNLVAKEFVAARDDERGVLVLSQFTGAAHELHEALIVNPYHVEQTAEALYQAPDHARIRTAGTDAQHARPGARLQRLPLGRPNAAGRRPGPPAGKAGSPDRAWFVTMDKGMIYLFSDEGRAALRDFVDRNTLFAFDLDGTLAPIVAEPSLILVPDELRAKLIRLGELASIAIVTGRACADAQGHLGFNPRFLVGNHGAEGLPGREEEESVFIRMGSAWEGQLRLLLPDEGSAGIVFENKGATLSVHYRNAPDPAMAQREITECHASVSAPPQEGLRQSTWRILRRRKHPIKGRRSHSSCVIWDTGGRSLSATTKRMRMYSVSRMTRFSGYGWR